MYSTSFPSLLNTTLLPGLCTTFSGAENLLLGEELHEFDAFLFAWEKSALNLLLTLGGLKTGLLLSGDEVVEHWPLFSPTSPCERNVTGDTYETLV